MRSYRRKAKIIPSRYIKHCLYRVQHYLARAISLPGRYIEYFGGMFSYRKSPMYKGVDYKRFSHEHGRYGEFQLWRSAKRALGGDCKWLCNLYLPKKDGSTCEVDLVAISSRGIFVFESKNYSGTIYGKEDKPYWYQMVRSDIRVLPKKSSFFNPIMQNGMHARAICGCIPEMKDHIHPIVVFGNRCRLKKVEWDKEKTTVTQCKHLSHKIRRYRKTVLSQNEIDMIYDRLVPYTKVGYLDKAGHIATIKEKQNKAYFERRNGN